jgi:hypothetical protein
MILEVTMRIGDYFINDYKYVGIASSLYGTRAYTTAGKVYDWKVTW